MLGWKRFLMLSGERSFEKKIGCRHSDDKREFISVARLKNMNEHSPNTEIVSK